MIDLTLEYLKNGRWIAFNRFSFSDPCVIVGIVKHFSDDPIARRYKWRVRISTLTRT